MLCDGAVASVSVSADGNSGDSGDSGGSGETILVVEGNTEACFLFN
jgi:hypothetical protein